MTKMPKALIASDIQRCKGNLSAYCIDCARREQIALDDQTRWYPYIMGCQPLNGRCLLKIEKATS